ncbi:MAG: hypothetical protein WKF61_04975 [Luteimonas sp.]
MTGFDRPSVELTPVRMIGALGLAAFSIAALMSWRNGDDAVACLFAAFAMLALYLLMSAGQIAADSSVVTVSSVLGQYALAWQNVRRVETSAYGTLVLHADDARLVLPPPLLWSGPHKPALRALIAEQLRQGSLIIERRWTADYATHKNVRIRRRSR